MITVSLPLYLPSVANLREHWSVKAKRVRMQKSVVVLALRPLVRGVKPPCVVTITRVAPRRLDADNAVASTKAVIDGIACCLGIDDRDERIEWRWGQRKGRPKEYGVEIRIDPTSRRAHEEDPTEGAGASSNR